MSKEVLEGLGVGEIKKEIETLVTELERATSGITGLGEKMSTALREAAAALKEVRKATNFTELREATEKTTKKTDEYAASQKALVEQQKTVANLTARLAALESQEAVAIQKARLEIAEKTKQQKAEAQAMIALEQSGKNYIDIMNKSAKSIKDLEAQNRQLRRVVETLDYSTQADEIAKLQSF
jgi:hypothetical protein